MNMRASIEMLSSALASADCENVAFDALLEFVGNFGIEKFTYHHLTAHRPADFDRKQFFARGYDAEVVHEFKLNLDAFHSPFVEHILKASDPMAFKEIFSQLDKDDERTDYWFHFYLSQHNNGIVIPVFGSKSRNGYFVLAAKTAQTQISARRQRALKWACQETHLKLCQVLSEQIRISVSLTAREKEILTWVARGKSNSVIADIMGISPHTVNGYLRTVYLKTGVTDRTSAALVGVGNDLISV